MKNIYISAILLLILSCTSTENTIKNIDTSAKKLAIRNNAFIFTEYANDKNYGYDKDYPVNIGVLTEKQEQEYIDYFFNGLTGKNNEEIIYNKVSTCCPYPTKNNTMGAATLSVYEISFENSDKKHTLYFNIYERGKVMCPNGFSIKSFPTMNY